jgi:hypothetical protein
MQSLFRLWQEQIFSLSPKERNKEGKETLALADSNAMSFSATAWRSIELDDDGHYYPPCAECLPAWGSPPSSPECQTALPQVNYSVFYTNHDAPFTFLSDKLLTANTALPPRSISHEGRDLTAHVPRISAPYCKSIGLILSAVTNVLMHAPPPLLHFVNSHFSFILVYLHTDE